MNIKRAIFLIITLVAGAILWPVPSWADEDGLSEATAWKVSTWAVLKQKMASGGYIQLVADCIDETKSTDSYLNIQSGKTVSIDLNGYKIDRGLTTATDNGYVIKNAGNLTICDSYTGTDRTHVITVNGENHTIDGGLITGGYNESYYYSGGIFNDGGRLTLESGTIAGNIAKNNGGGIYNKGTFTMNNGSICYNSTNVTGGGVYNHRDWTFTMNNGSISYNTASQNAGGIFAFGTFTMNNGTISHNTTALDGGGIYAQRMCYLRGGSIEYNICGNDKNGGGIYYNWTNNSYTTVMRGEIFVRNNKKGSLETGAANNFYFYNSNIKITLDGALSSDARIGLTCYRYDVSLTSGFSTYGHTSNFVPDDDNYEAVSVDNELQLKTHWAALRTKMNAGGEIVLDRDYVSNNESYLYVPSNKTVVLDLNGYKIDQGRTSSNSYGNVIVVEKNGQLTIKDTYTGTDRTHVITVNGENHTIVGGLITGGYITESAASGGGIYVQGTFILESGTIAGNTATNGGGVCIGNLGSSFMMRGGTICYNTAVASNTTQGGGGVFVYDNKTFTMLGGTICNNAVSASGYGGGVYARGTFKLGDPDIVNPSIITITNNKNTSNNDCNVQPNGLIYISGVLNAENRIGIYKGLTPNENAFTSGLNGKGSASNFISDNPSYVTALNSDGEAILKRAMLIDISCGEHGSITTTPAEKAAEGTTITVSATPDDDYYLSSLRWERYDASNIGSDFLDSKQFVMPGYRVVVKATFSRKMDLTGHTVSIVDWVYGNSANSPDISGNLGNGDVTYQYKVKDSDDGTYNETVPTLAGDYTVKASIEETEKYHAATCTYDFTISQRDVTVTALAQTVTYGDNIVTSPSASAMGTYATLTNGISGHAITALTLAKTQTDYSASAHSNDITPSTATIKDAQNNDVTANYNISYINGDLTINQRAVTVTAKAQTITYGSNIVTNPEADVMDTYATLTNGVSGHAITALTLAKTQTEYSATAYNNDITPSSATIKDAQSNDVTANYDISYSNGDLTINKKGVTVTALPQTIIYGSNIVTTPVTAEVSTYASLTDALEGHTLTAISLAKTKTNVSETAYIGDITPSGATIKNGETDVTSNYSISYADGDLTIQPYDISTTALTITPIDDQTYTGSAIEPTTSVTVDALNDEALTADYSYSEDHTNVGTVNISLTGTGNFTGTNANATSYKIVPKALEDGMIAAISDELYIGSGVEPELTVTYNEQSLTKGTHYTTSFENNTISGEATVTIAAVDNTNYSGTATATFNIIAANLNTATVTGEDVVTKFYDGTTAITVPESDVEVKFGSNPKLTDEYQVVYRKAYRSDTESLSSITDIGEYTIVIQPKEGNTCVTGELVSTLKVNVQLPVSLKQCEWVTYYDERFDLVTPEGYQAYKVATANSNGVTAETIDYIPKGIPVILKTTATGTSDNSMTINLNEQQTPSAVVGATEFKGVASSSDGVMPTGSVYILVGKKFVLFEGTEGIPKHRCYLEFAAPAKARSIGIGFEDEGLTSIHDVRNIDNREHWYDLHGQRIEQPKRKGLYIKDGQKVVIK